MTALTDDTLPITPRAMRDEMIVFGIMAVLLAIVPFTGIYPFFVMQALGFALVACAFNLLIGYGGILSLRHGLFLCSGSDCARRAEGLEPAAEARHRGWYGRRLRARYHHRRRVDPPAGHLFLDDHAGLVAAALLHL